MPDIGVAEWAEPKCEGTGPSPRSGHSLTVLGRRGILFGGLGEDNNEVVMMNDVHALDLSGNEPSWSPLSCEGKVPEGRWRHTATVLGEAAVMIFGGIGASNKRFNDCWVLDVSGDTPVWVEQATSGNRPCPRAHHSATMVDDHLYVFGGYGGHGQRRAFYNDVHLLKTAGEDETTLEWVKVEANGTPPQPRGNHTASLLAVPASSTEKLLMIMGGRNHSMYFDDVHFLNLSTHTWTSLEDVPSPSAPCLVANHLAVAIPSVPNYKVFVFGGQEGSSTSRTEWKYINNVNCLECGRMEWMASDEHGANFVQGTFPTAREDVAYAYDKKSGRILVHGGWADKFLCELFTLDVSAIVGPPYAVYSLHPNEGPLTGSTPVRIVGEDFGPSSSIKVMFTDGKNTETVDGKFVSPTEITCKSPDWTKYAAGEVNVRVNLRGDGFTVNMVKWTFFINTKPTKCIAYGPGLFDSENAGWGFPAVFKVQAKDQTGRNRNSGGEAEYWQPRIMFKETGENVPARVEDCGDGTYDVIYVPPHPGQYVIDLGYCDPLVQGEEVIPIRGSPWKASFDDPWIKAKSQNEAPKAVPGTQTCSIMKKMVLFGGTLEELVCYDPDNQAWERPEVEGTSPVKRINHTMTPLDNEKAAIIGGQFGDKVFYNDVWLLICEKGKWRWQEAGDVHGDKWTARARHAACLIPVGKRVVVLGGTEESGEKLDDLSVLAAQNIAKMEWMGMKKRVVVEEEEEPEEEGEDANGQAEGEEAPNGDAPPAEEAKEKEEGAEEEGEEEDGGDGGGGEGQPKKEGEEEVEEKKPLPVLKEVPGRRGGHGAAAVEGVVYVFGGEADVDGEGALTNVTVVGEFEQEGKTLSRGDAIRWRRVKASGDIPCPRSDFNITTLDGKVVIQGGRDVDGELLDDVYSLDPATGVWTVLYRSDNAWQKMGHVVSCLIGKRLITASAKAADSKSKYDDVRILEFGKIAQDHSLLMDMPKRVVKELRQLETFNEESIANLSLDPTKEADEEKQREVLLKVKGCIYQVKVDQPAIELQLDILKDALTYMNKHNIQVEKMEKEMKDVVDNFGTVKKQMPTALEIIKPVQQREANKIREEIEKFTLKVKIAEKDFGTREFMTFETGVDGSYTAATAEKKHFWQLDKEMEGLIHFATVFEFPELTDEAKGILDSLHQSLTLMIQLWHMVDMVQFQMDLWSQTLWADINTEEMEDGTKQFFKLLRAQDKIAKTSDTFLVIEKNVKGFLASLPLVSDLRHPSMRPRHWQMLRELTHKQFDETSDTFDLKTLNELHLNEFEEDVGEIVNRAQKEEKMEQALAKIESTWKSLEFQFTQHKDTDIQMIKLSEEDFETLEDHQVQIQNMMGSRYLSTFEEQVTSWQAKLSGVADVVGIMAEIQRTWAYLETLFIGSDEVKKELPEDAERFVGIDKDVKQVLKDMFAKKNAVEAATEEGLYKMLEGTQQKLQMCEKSLKNYLEQKRRIFPRFYFVSTSDLLDILSNGNDPTKVNFHMSKIIAAIDTLQLQSAAVSTERPSALGFDSCVGVEHIDLSEPLKIDGRVENYLQMIIDNVVSSLRKVLVASIESFSTTPTDVWVKREPNQIILTTSLVYFTKKMEEAFAGLKSGNDKAMEQMLQSKKDALRELIDLVRTDLTKAERMKIMCLITLDAHSRDISQNLLDGSVTEVTQFEWQSQLRFEWRANEGDCFIMIVDAEFHYSFEYIGNGARLVITPLTDRIYVTATQALKLCMGCAPAGPAGTGKTETTKDLAAMMAVCIYVFNCAPEMDYQSMGDIWKGLGASGAWGCFDEFNRLIAEVLSVCSTQYKSVLDAIKAGRDTFILDGAELQLNPSCGAYITMNPGYIGRTALPESLKVLFRPVTVVVPDFALICENMLMAEGFTQAKILGTKFINLYTLCGDLLSKAMHYDWGLRAIKSVLRVAGDFKRAEPEVSELALLFRALRDFNLPKIVGDDLIIFMGLLSDLFPGIEIPRQRNWDNEKVIAEVITEAGLQPDEDFQLKVVQLDELLAIRHCVFIMGSSGTGKSENWKILSGAKIKQGNKCVCRDLDPKAITTYDFYGYVSLATREWKDGVFSSILRDLANAPDTNSKWVILDGDLDANWVESMNSVMDDNKLLTLASNERILMKPHMKLIFELRDLKYATPATASRAGITFITEKRSQWYSYVQSWIARRADDTPERKELLLGLFEKYVDESLAALKKEFKHMAPTLDFNLVMSLCNVLQGLLTPENVPKGDAKEAVLLETYFCFAAVWAFGSGYSITDGFDFRKAFSSWWKGKWTAIKMPMKGSVFDFFIDKQTQKFVAWSQIVPHLEYTSTTPMDAVTVPTGETTSITFYLDLLVELRKPALLVGLAGSGKTALVNGKLRTLPDDYMTLVCNFNYYTESAGFQAVMEGALEKKAGKNYGPPGSKKLIYFVDDLNMPKLDPYETATPISLLRQYLDYEHWYDLQKLQLRLINNCQIICAMNPTCGSFVINPRLQRHFMVFAIGFPGQEALMTIFSTFLNGHVKEFEPKIADVAFQNKIIQAALELHNKVSQTFRKTASNFHYEFSIRHLANVFKGILMSEPGFFPDPAKFASLFLHEAERVYGDRLVSPKDLETYQKLSKDTGKKFFKDLDQATVFPNPHIFCNCWKDLDEKSYNRPESMEKLSKILTDALTSYNETNAAMNLVLFDDAIKHICRIARIIQNGHALLVGVGGSGKQSLTRLSAFIAGCSVFQIVLSGTYSMSDLKEDIKQMYNKAGLKGEQIVFLFTDSQIADEKFLVYMNELLSSGKIPNLFASDEIDSIYGAIRNEGKSEGVADAKEPMYDFFIAKVKKNLHACLCFSPVGENFRRRASRFPSLINCTVIDWYQPWPENALFDVAKRFLGQVELGDEKSREGIISFVPFSFGAVNNASVDYLQQERRYNYTTPKSFLELIYLYRNMLKKERDSLNGDVERLSTGLDKLEKTAKDVAVLEEEIKVKSVEVAEAKKSADEIAEKVGSEKAKVEEAAAAAQDEAVKCSVKAESAGKIKVDCDRDLSAAIPMVEKAEAALNTLNKKDLGELKSLAKPPAGVDDVTNAILALRGEPKKNWDWGNAKNMMKDVNKFIEDLKGMQQIIDNMQLPAKNVDATRPILELDHIKDIEIMRKKSQAAAGLCDFLLNIVAYYDIVVTVEPKRNALKQAEEELEAANTKLAEVKAYVADLEEKLAVLIAEFDKVNAEKNRVVAEGERLQNKLALAQRLMAALGSEQERWKINVAKMKEDSVLLAGDVLLAASFVSYIGCFNKRFRDELINGTMLPFMKKAAIPMSENADPLTLLASPAVVAEWNGQGLPADRVSVENGAISTFAERWPVMIDPQLQGIVWVKEKESQNNLALTRLGNKDLLSKMERALENGWTVMIENLQESLDAVLAPIIGRQTIKKGRNFFVKVGDKEVEYSPKFKLYLHTKLANPHYPPEIQAECTLINFMVTEDGLEDQLLAKVVTKERPDLEEEKSSLIKQQNEFKIKLKELESGLLRQLAEAQGDITENIELIESLEDAKRLSIEISEKVAVAQETEIRINEAREEYRGVANRGALLFFALGEMFKVHSFYHYSLSAFTSVFLRAIDWAGKKYVGAPVHVPKQIALCSGKNAFQRFRTVQLLLRAGAKGLIGGDDEKGPGKPSTQKELDLQARLVDLIASITYQVFNFCRRGLFDKHKLLFTTSVVFKVLVRMKELDPEEVGFITFGKRSPNPPPLIHDMAAWCSDLAWAGAHAVQEIKVFEKLCADMEADQSKWQAWLTDERPEEKALPGDYEKITAFQKLILLRQLRPDRLTGAMRTWVGDVMGKRYINEEAFDIFGIYRESAPETALYFYLFPGADIVADLTPLMNAKGFTTENGKFINISMGQGQEEVAEQALDRCMKEGGWVFLQNIHLMSQWVKKLERKLEASQDPDTNKDFRCFLSAEPPGLPLQQTIPEAILQNSIKISNEPAQSLRQLLFRAWNNFDQSNLDACKRPKDFRTILLALCVFHAMVNGRKKFGNMGWNCGHIYGFTLGDLTQCADVLNNQLNARSGARANEDAPLRDLRYIFGEIMYGGHITDKWDRRANITYLDVIITPRLTDDEFELFPGFKTKQDGTWDDYLSYVENEIPPETPVAFGMHANAEINFLMSEQRDLFNDLLSIGGGGGGGVAGGKSREQVVDGIITDLAANLPENFDNVELKEKIGDNLTPYLVVLIQERERFNGLLSEIRQSLKELRLGLDGALNISDKMETMMDRMVIFKIPPFWEKMAWRTNKNLTIWFADVNQRVTQLQEWGASISMPPSLWLAGCFNPMAFITAVMQTTARKRGWPLDDVVTFTDPTTMDWEEADQQPEEGAFVHGMFIEGARWDRESGEIRDSFLRDLTPQMPIMHVVAIPRTEVKVEGYHDTPVYYVSQRGGGNPPGSYVFFATLKTSETTTRGLYGVYSYKWVLAGVGLLMQVE